MHRDSSHFFFASLSITVHQQWFGRHLLWDESVFGWLMDLQACARSAVFIKEIMGGLRMWFGPWARDVLMSDSPTTLLRPSKSACWCQHALFLFFHVQSSDKESIFQTHSCLYFPWSRFLCDGLVLSICLHLGLWHEEHTAWTVLRWLSMAYLCRVLP